MADQETIQTDEACRPGDDLTHRLLHAAAEVFAEKGYERAGVAEIARRAGVTTGAIYSRYGGKAELLLEAVDHHVPDSIDNILNGGSAVNSPTEVLSSLGDHLLDPLDWNRNMVKSPDSRRLLHGRFQGTHDRG